MDLATLCDTYMEVKMAPMDAIWLFSVLTPPFHGYPSIPTLPLYRSVSGIGYVSKNCVKWLAIQLAYPLNSW